MVSGNFPSKCMNIAGNVWEEGIFWLDYADILQVVLAGGRIKIQKELPVKSF